VQANHRAWQGKIQKCRRSESLKIPAVTATAALKKAAEMINTAKTTPLTRKTACLEALR
jgi:hypothetical protein